MRKRLLKLYSIVLFCLLTFTVSGVSGQVSRITVSIDGLACPFCAYGVEKKLKRIEGVKSIRINIQEGNVVLSAKNGESININNIPMAVEDSGFTPRRIEVEAAGMIKVNQEGEVTLNLQGDAGRFVFSDLKRNERELLTSYAERGIYLLIGGEVELKSGGEWELTPVSIEEASE